MASLLPAHGGNLRAAAAKYGIDEKNLLDFSANINPLGPSPQAIQAILTNLPRIVHYPDPDCVELREELAVEVGLTPQNVVLGNGAVELLFLLMHLLRPQKVLLPVPTFGEYAKSVTTAGGVTKSLPLKREENFVLNIENLMDEMHDVDGVIICNPNNPTGQIATADLVEQVIARALTMKKWVMVDEAFMDFIVDKEAYSVVKLVGKYPNLFVLYSLTKFYAIPGLRLGAGFGDKGLIKKLMDTKDPWNVNCLAQAAGLASIRDDEYKSQTLKVVENERGYMYQKLESIQGIIPYVPSVNYIFCEITKPGLTSGELVEEMGRQGFLIRDCSNYENLDNRYIRMAVRTREENDRLLTVLREIF